MAKKQFHLSLSGALYELGSRIQFAPTSAFASSREEEEKHGGKLASRLLPYKKKVKGALSKMAEQSAILELLRRFVKYIFTLRIRSLGIFFFLCGFIQIAAYFAIPFLAQTERSADHLLFGVAQIFLALLCSFSRGDVADSLKKSLFFRVILQTLFGVKEWQIPGGKSRDRGAAAFFAGLACGVLSLFVPPTSIVKGTLVVVIVLFVFFSPEAGLTLSVAVAMLGNVQSLLFSLLLTLISFFFKCSVGKRSLIVSPMDPAVFLFLLPFLLATPNGDDHGYFLLFFLYALVACLIRTLASAVRILSAVSTVSFVLSVFVSIRRCVETFAPFLFSRVEGLDVFCFVRADAGTGILIAASIPLIMGMMKGKVAFRKRFFRFVSLTVHLLALALIGDVRVWLAALLGSVVFILFSFKGGLLFLSMAGLTFLSVLRILPPEPASSLLGFFGVRMDFLTAASELTEMSLVEYFDVYGGIFWGLSFMLLLGFYFYEIISFGKKNTNVRMHSVVFGSVCAAVVFLTASVQSMELNYRNVALFLLFVALPRAARRAALREEVRLPY